MLIIQIFVRNFRGYSIHFDLQGHVFIHITTSHIKSSKFCHFKISKIKRDIGRGATDLKLDDSDVYPMKYWSTCIFAMKFFHMQLREPFCSHVDSKHFLCFSCAYCISWFRSYIVFLRTWVGSKFRRCSLWDSNLWELTPLAWYSRI